MTRRLRPGLLATALLASASRAGEEWDRSRGPDGAGRAPAGVRLPDALDPQQNLLWSAELPPGHSSPCLRAERVLVTGCAEGELATLCLDRRDGKVRSVLSRPDADGEGDHPLKHAQEDRLRVISALDLGERRMATPALSDGVVYLRTKTKLRAFGHEPAGSPRVR